MGNYIIIPKKEKESIYDRDLRVAAYCRVSTDKEQIDSLNSQIIYFKEFIQKRENWKLTEVYYDEGISGTSRKKRDGFNKLIAKAEAKEIDFILTKEVSRFSRNLIDTMTIARDLREKGIYIWFTDDDLNTENDRDMETLVDIAKQAQRESERTSRRVKWGQTERMKQGVVFGREMLGYRVINGKLELVEEEAKIIKLIFDLYESGIGTYKIAEKLRKEGIQPKNSEGKAKSKFWGATVILRVLRNEKYVGDLLQKKTYTVDPLSHKKQYNRGEEDQVYIKDHHKDIAIIDRGQWDRVQAELKRRKTSHEQKSRHSNRYWCSGKISCGVCQSKFVSRTKKLKNGETYKAWRCFKAANHGRSKIVEIEGVHEEIGCNSEAVNDKTLQLSMKFLLGFIIDNKEELRNEILSDIQMFKQTIKAAKKEFSKRGMLLNKIEKVEKEQMSLTRLYAQGKLKESLYKSSIAESDLEKANLKKEIEEIDEKEKIVQAQGNEIHKYVAEIDRILSFENIEDNESIYKEVLDKITVQPGRVLEVYLKCLSKPIHLRYVTEGKLDEYTADFTFISNG